MPYLIFRDQNTREKVYKLKLGINKIGRLLDNDIVFSDSSVSRNHATIEVQPNQTIIKDLNSKNHTFVNEVEVSKFLLKEGDLVTFGNVTLIYDSIYKLKANLVINQQQPIIVKQINSQQNVQLFGTLNITQSTHHSLINIASKNREQRILEKLRILLEISKQLCSPEKPEQILNKVLDFLFKVMDIDRAVILLVNEQTNKLELKAVKLAYELEDTGQFYSSKITNLARETGDIIVTANAMTDERFKNSKSIVSSSVHASICVPLKINGLRRDPIIGVLYIDNLFMPSVYDDEDVEFLSCLANQAAAAIHMANEFDKREQELKRQINEFIAVFKN